VSYVGSTGFSTGNHLHYEIHLDGKPINPLDFMLAHGVDIQKRLEAASGATIINWPPRSSAHRRVAGQRL